MNLNLIIGIVLVCAGIYFIAEKQEPIKYFENNKLVDEQELKGGLPLVSNEKPPQGIVKVSY